MLVGAAAAPWVLGPAPGVPHQRGTPTLCQRGGTAEPQPAQEGL